jgi:hypothetical protein
MELQKLKQKLINDKDLAPVYAFFLDHFGENAKFMTLGDTFQHPMLETIVAQIGQQMFPRSGTVQSIRLIRLADEKFVHGSFIMGGRIGGVFYFEDCQTGLVTVPELPPSNEVKYARFSAKLQAPEPSRN